jgi:hypothetical protein
MEFNLGLEAIKCANFFFSKTTIGAIQVCFLDHSPEFPEIPDADN